MPMEAPSTVPVSKPLPANLSMKPYLSYELGKQVFCQYQLLPTYTDFIDNIIKNLKLVFINV